MTTSVVPRNLHALPTLTEVIELPVLQAEPAPPGAIEGRDVAGQHLPPEAVPMPDVDEARLVGQVLVDLLRHADLMLEYRLREAVEPALARVADALVRDLRDELAATLRDIVARSVSQELARQRGRVPPA
jgi:hypothetical protein